MSHRKRLKVETKIGSSSSPTHDVEVVSSSPPSPPPTPSLSTLSLSLDLDPGDAPPSPPHTPPAGAYVPSFDVDDEDKHDEDKYDKDKYDDGDEHKKEEESFITFPEYPMIPPYMPLKFLSKTFVRSDLTMLEEKNLTDYVENMQSVEPSTANVDTILFYNNLLVLSVRKNTTDSRRVADTSFKMLDTVYKEIMRAGRLAEQEQRDKLNYLMAISYLGRVSLINHEPKDQTAVAAGAYREAFKCAKLIHDPKQRYLALSAIFKHQLQAFKEMQKHDYYTVDMGTALHSEEAKFVLEYTHEEPVDPAVQIPHLLMQADISLIAFRQPSVSDKKEEKGEKDKSKLLLDVAGLLQKQYYDMIETIAKDTHLHVLFFDLLGKIFDIQRALQISQEDMRKLVDEDILNHIEFKDLHGFRKRCEELLSAHTKRASLLDDEYDDEDELTGFIAPPPPVLPAGFVLEHKGERYDGTCFDAAIEEDRTKFLNFFMDEFKVDPVGIVRLMAPEIMNAAIGSAPTFFNEDRIAMLLRELSVDSIDAAARQSFKEELEGLLAAQMQSNRAYLPAVCQTRELKGLVDRYLAADDVLREKDSKDSAGLSILDNTRIMLGDFYPFERAQSLQEVLERFELKEDREKNLGAYQYLQAEINRVYTPRIAPLLEYCSRPDVVHSYIIEYYKKVKGWVVVPKDFHGVGRKSTSIIDIYAKFIKRQIVVYEKDKVLYQTAPVPTQPVAYVWYNGSHYTRLRDTRVPVMAVAVASANAEAKTVAVVAGSTPPLPPPRPSSYSPTGSLGLSCLTPIDLRESDVTGSVSSVMPAASVLPAVSSLVGSPSQTGLVGGTVTAETPALSRPSSAPPPTSRYRPIPRLGVAAVTSPTSSVTNQSLLRELSPTEGMSAVFTMTKTT